MLMVHRNTRCIAFQSYFVWNYIPKVIRHCSVLSAADDVGREMKRKTAKSQTDVS